VRDQYRGRIVELAVKTGLPVMYTNREFVLTGGLMSYQADRLAQFRRAATYVDKILKGTTPTQRRRRSRDHQWPRNVEDSNAVAWTTLLEKSFEDTQELITLLLASSGVVDQLLDFDSISF